MGSWRRLTGGPFVDDRCTKHVVRLLIGQGNAGLELTRVQQHSKDADEIVETVECSDLWRRSEVDNKALGRVPVQWPRGRDDAYGVNAKNGRGGLCSQFFLTETTRSRFCKRL
jgi:hypothetical protein